MSLLLWPKYTLRTPTALTLLVSFDDLKTSQTMGLVNLNLHFNNEAAYLSVHSLPTFISYSFITNSSSGDSYLPLSGELNGFSIFCQFGFICVAVARLWDVRLLRVFDSRDVMG
jgi:hypothetical protein